MSRKTTGRIKKRVKKLKNKKPLSKKIRLYETALRLQQNMPLSEVWFHRHLSYLLGRHPRDQINVPFAFYIPDMINKKYKYIVEVDGSIHDSDEQRAKDFIKDKYYASRGFTVFRVMHMNYAELAIALKGIAKLRGQEIIIPEKKESDENELLSLRRYWVD